jgi:hypothetical protein
LHPASTLTDLTSLTLCHPLTVPSAPQLSSNLYLYLRWIWIQFPWIGLHVAQDVATTLKQIRDDEEKHRCVLVCVLSGCDITSYCRL